MTKPKYILFLLLTFNICFIQAQIVDTLKKKQHVELSFGHSLLFISSSKLVDIHAAEAIVVPTSAVLFLAEFRPQKTLRIPVFISIATESKQFLVDSQLINEKASPTIGTGLMYKFLQIKIDSKSNIEFEIGPMVSILFDTNKSIRVAPIFAGRLRLTRGENFSMYIGSSYSIGINAIGILYGTGTVF